MTSEDISQKEKINMLTPINNIFGTHESRVSPVLAYLAVAVFPVLVYITYLPFWIPIWLFVIFEVLWAARWALKLLGKEDARLEEYRKSSKNIYENSKDLVKIAHCYDGGMIEYQNGTITIVLTGYTRMYANDNVYSSDLERFMAQLDKYTPDVYLHQVVGEDNLQDASENLRVYDDKEFMEQRSDLYAYNDNFVNTNSKLWRFTFAVKAYKHNWKTTEEDLEAVINSAVAKRVFFYIEIAKKDVVSSIASRDIGAYLSIDELLRDKYVNDNYDGSRVLFYGDDVPEEYKEEFVQDKLEDRREVFVDDKKKGVK